MSPNWVDSWIIISEFRQRGWHWRETTEKSQHRDNLKMTSLASSQFLNEVVINITVDKWQVCCGPGVTGMYVEPRVQDGKEQWGEQITSIKRDPRANLCPFSIALPDLASKNIAWHVSYTNKFILYLKFSFHQRACILSDNPTSTSAKNWILPYIFLFSLFHLPHNCSSKFSMLGYNWLKPLFPVKLCVLPEGKAVYHTSLCNCYVERPELTRDPWKATLFFFLTLFKTI